MDAMSNDIAGGTFSLLNGAIAGKLAVYREMPDSDMIISLELEFTFHKAKPSASAPVRGV